MLLMLMEFVVQSGSFVGSTDDLALDTKWQGFTKGIFGSNLFMLKTRFWKNICKWLEGGITKTQFQSGEKMILDNYQLVSKT